MRHASLFISTAVVGLFLPCLHAQNSIPGDTTNPPAPAKAPAAAPAAAPPRNASAPVQHFHAEGRDSSGRPILHESAHTNTSNPAINHMNRQSLEHLRRNSPPHSLGTQNGHGRDTSSPRDLTGTQANTAQPNAPARHDHHDSDSVDRHRTKPKPDRMGFINATRRHHHEWHDRGWWKHHCPIIVLVNSGYYFWDAGYWYPAWGYDQTNSYYPYDGPIYTYGNLLPDEVIANVQSALQQEGYYDGEINGSLDSATRLALANYQRDQGLLITGGIDEATVAALGLD